VNFRGPKNAQNFLNIEKSFNLWNIKQSELTEKLRNFSSYQKRTRKYPERPKIPYSRKQNPISPISIRLILHATNPKPIQFGLPSTTKKRRTNMRLIRAFISLKISQKSGEQCPVSKLENNGGKKGTKIHILNIWWRSKNDYTVWICGRIMIIGFNGFKVWVFLEKEGGFFEFEGRFFDVATFYNYNKTLKAQ
jgi:hypothetical protein